MEPWSVWLSDRDKEDEQQLLAKVLPTWESIKGACEREDEAEKDDEEVAHQVHDVENHPN